MTRKDYQAIAAALFERLTTLEPSRTARTREDAYKDQHRHLCGNVADALANDNPRFDRDRFLAACGVGVQS